MQITKDMKILLIGGAGFIGYHLSKELIGANEVSIFENFSNFVQPKSIYPAYLLERMNFLKINTTIIRGDIRYQDSINQCLEKTKPDIIIHLAAIPIASVCNQNINNTLGVNLNGTINILNCLKNCKPKRFIYISSSFVYGHFKGNSVTEESPTYPIDIYGATKLSGEIFTKMFCSQSGIEWVIIRPSAVYGDTDCNQRVTQIIIDNAREGKEIILENNGKQKLDFTYVGDLAFGLSLVCISKAAKNQIFNMTYGQARSVFDFANEVKKHYPDMIIKRIQQKSDRPKRGTLNIDKARKLLYYTPVYPIEKGVEKY